MKPPHEELSIRISKSAGSVMEDVERGYSSSSASSSDISLPNSQSQPQFYNNANYIPSGKTLFGRTTNPSKNLAPTVFQCKTFDDNDFEDETAEEVMDDSYFSEEEEDSFSDKIGDYSMFKSTAAMPKNGTGLPLIYPSPQHINAVPPEPEEICRVDEGITAVMMQKDAERQQNSHLILNRVVYDSIDPSPLYQPENGKTVQTGSKITVNINDISVNSDFDTMGDGKAKKVTLKPYYIRMNEEDNTLVFESRFESGNLRRAIQVYEYEYDLILNFDINTRGHTQWFYFSISNARKGCRYKFNIINLLKPSSLYSSGMQPIMYSENNAKTKGIGWVRTGYNICYYQNTIKRRSRYYYTLTWTFDNEHDKDTIYFAYSHPYTYSNLQQYLRNLENDVVRKNFIRRRVLCQTIAGNNCDLLTITSFLCDPQALKNRKGIVISSRVHPGETNASWMMKGIIDYLTGPTPEAKILRDNFVFKIVPMLNPDGVINGNYRCSLLGADLNRRWIEPSKKLHPTVFHTKQMMKKFQEDRDIFLFIDLHGHSRKKNIFMYGCSDKHQSPSKRILSRVFPRLLWRVSQCFSYQDCNFGLQKSKESTARIVMFRQFEIINSFTMEASFCGSDFGKHASKQFTTKHLEQMGHFLCEALLSYTGSGEGKLEQVMNELEVLYTPETLDVEDDAGDSEGSDDDPSDDEDRKKKLRKKKKKKPKRKPEKKPVKKERVEVPKPDPKMKKAQSSSAVDQLAKKKADLKKKKSTTSDGESDLFFENLVKRKKKELEGDEMDEPFYNSDSASYYGYLLRARRNAIKPNVQALIPSVYRTDIALKMKPSYSTSDLPASSNYNSMSPGALPKLKPAKSQFSGLSNTTISNFTKYNGSIGSTPFYRVPQQNPPQNGVSFYPQRTLNIITLT